jgi:alkanesulfonate monooxygenase SsuD/methylene tetrahydromethanopterin reductase-like flavin-dependent oxidoreductase (luciferase family)
MHFGLFMMPLHPPHRSFADSYQRDVEQIVLADRLGVQEAWVGEHLTERWENAPGPREESGGFGTLLSIMTDSDDAGWDQESLRLLMEQVAPWVAHLS